MSWLLPTSVPESTMGGGSSGASVHVCVTCGSQLTPNSPPLGISPVGGRRESASSKDLDTQFFSPSYVTRHGLSSAYP